MLEKPYSNRELDLKFLAVETSIRAFRRELLDPIEGFLPRIERQTTKHNGRMTKAERVLIIIGTAVVVLVADKIPSVAHALSFLIP